MGGVVQFCRKKLSNFFIRLLNLPICDEKRLKSADSIIISNSKSCQIEIIRLNLAKVLEFLIEFGQSCKV